MPFDAERDHWRGGGSPAVTLLVYGDYECPYTRLAYRSLQRIEPRLGGDLRFVFRHFPLIEKHPHALAAAGFAEAAARQGKYWEMHDLLFSRQKALEDDDLRRYADELGLDRERLDQDLTDPAVWQRINQDASSAVASGGRGTPTIFVDDRLYTESYDEPALEAELRRTIERERA
jgi:protein-disulfide isomerase